MARVWTKDYLKKKGLLPSKGNITNSFYRKQLERLEIEKQKIRDEKNALRKYRRAYARTELMCEYITDSIEKLKPMPYSRPRDLIFNYKEVLVLVICDVHAYSIVRPEEINNINEYNYDIFIERLNKLKEEILHIRDRHEITKLHIIWNGDLLDNDRIFKIQQMYIQESAVNQLMSAAEVFSSFLRDLSGYFLEIENDYAPGNHGRLSKNRDEEHLSNNLEFILFWYINERLKHITNIKFNLNMNFFIDREILGYKILAFHGEKERQIENSLNAYTSMFSKFYDYLITGHLHNLKNIDGDNYREIIQCPSFVGANLYSVSSLKKATAPSQIAFTIREGYGKYAMYKIKL